MATEIPPIIVSIIGQNRELVTKLTESKALLADFAKNTTDARIGADSKPFQADLTTVRTELLKFAQQVNDAKLGADAAPFWADVAKLRAEVGAMSPLDIRVDANTAAALAKIEALRGALALSSVDALIPATSAAGGGGGGGLLAGLLGGLLGGGKGGGGAGLLSTLGWGGGFLGMAKFGSLLSLMGFGAEHLITSGIGIGGSLLGGALGGGLLGAGALGTLGVGMGTDMAGMGQAAGDIRNVVTAQNQLNQAIAVYGRNSIQAQQAQAQLNYTLSSFSPIARQAVLQAANTAQGFHAMFNRLTGAAEKTGAQIINQAMLVGEKFLPTIGKYAAENMKIIQHDIQPFFDWLQNKGSNGGLGIFTELEKIFQSQLPTGIKAVTQGIEFFARTIGVAARYTGGFTRALAKFFTHMNQAGPFSSWSKEIGKLIGLFHSWLDLFGSLIGVVAAVFKPAVGFGQAFANTLRAILDQIKTWLSLTSTQSTLHGLFSAHLGEVIKGIGGAISALLPFAESFVAVFAKIAAVGARVASFILIPIDKVLTALSKVPFLKSLVGWALGLGLVYKAFAPLKAAITAFVTDNPWGAILTVAVFAATQIYAHWHGLLTGLKAIWNGIKTAAKFVWNGIKSFFHSTIGQIILAVTNPIAGLVNFLFQHWNTIKSDAVTAWHAVLAFLKTIPSAIIGLFKNAGQWLVQAGKDLLNGLVKGVESMASSAFDAVKHVASGIWHGITSFFGIHSPSTLMQFAGQNIVQGLVLGLHGNKETPLVEVRALGTQMVSLLHSELPMYRSAGAEIGDAIAQGLESSQGAIAAALQQTMTVAVNSAVQSAIQSGLASAKSQIASSLRSGSAYR